MSRAVVSDFGGVLTSPLQEAFLAWETVSGIPLSALGASMTTLTERTGLHPLYELECGRITEAAFQADLAAQMTLDLGRDVNMDGFTETYFANLRPNAVLLDYLAALRADGVRLALLTNNVREWGPYWRSMFAVDDLFELVVDSAFVGMRKPDQEIYRLTCERFGVAPESCAFIDDFAHNCDAAASVGLHPVWYQGDDAATIAAVDAFLGR